MKVNFNDIENFIQFYTQVKDESFPFQTAYKLSKLYKFFNEEVTFFSDEMQKIIDTYAKRDENGQYTYGTDGTSILILEDKLDECQVKLNELQSVEINAPENIEFDINEFNDIKLSPQHIQTLMKFIKKETLD